MEQAEENKYVSQLSEVFSSCDTTGTGYLDKEELTELCHKLHLEAQLPLLLQTLLGSDHFARVHFEEFKEGFVAVLSRTIDLSISEDESSYLQPVVPEEVKPKFMKGAKRYGRRSRPEVQATDVEATKYIQEHQVKGNRKNQLRRSASLESVESLKSDEEAESAKEPPNETFEAQGQMRSWNTDIFDSPRRASSPCSDMTENQVRDIWEELGIGNTGYLNKQELATVCKNIGLKDLKNEELEDLFNKLDQDGDGRVSFKEFQLGLFSHGPPSLPNCSTPSKQKRQWSLYQAFEDGGRTPSLLSSCGGLHLFSSIDDGTGFVNPERIITIWEEEGLEDGKDILKSLDFNLEEQVNLAELTIALDNELAATQNRIHQAGLASYRQELQHLQGQVEQISREKEKLKQDFERTERRNRQLASEEDDHHSVMELLNQSKISVLEQDYKEKVAAIRSELEKEREMFMQQADQQRTKLEADVQSLQMEETHVREKLTLCMKENSRLQKEMIEMVEKVSESEKLVFKLQKDLDMMLKERLRLMDPHSTEHFDQEERFAEIIREYEMQCRELRDRNDELQIELEKLRSQLNESKKHRLQGRRKDLKQLLIKSKINTNLNSDNMDKNELCHRLRRSLSTVGINGIISKDIDTSPLSIEAELTKEQLKEHQQELQDLRIQLETKVNYYEREIELMKRNFEKERKDIEQGFKMEVSELEEQKTDLEELNAKLEEVINGLKDQLQKPPQSQEIEKRFEKERAELEQYYAKEISNLAQRLAQEKDQLEEELKGNNQLELQSMRNEAEIELNQKLSKAETQYTEHVNSLLHQHQHDMEDLVQRYEVMLERMKERHAQEKKQWGEKETKIVMDCRKERLKYEERMNEEQARICRTFAVEKEAVKNSYRKQMDSLSCEIENLKIHLSEVQGDPLDTGLHLGEVKLGSLPKRPDPLENSPVSNEERTSQCQLQSSQQHSKEDDVLSMCKGDQLGPKDLNWKDDARKLESEFQSHLKEKDHLLEEQREQMKKQNKLYAEALTCIQANEEKLSLLGKSQQDPVIQLEQVLISKAILEEECKEMERLCEKERSLQGEQSVLNKQLSEQLQTKEHHLQIAKTKEGDLIFQLDQCSELINVQESKLEELAKEIADLQEEKLILIKQVRHFQEEMELLRKQEEDTTTQLRIAKEKLLEQQSVFETEQKKGDFITAQKAELLEACTETNEALSRQLKSIEEELVSFQMREEEVLALLKLKEEEAVVHVHQAKAEFEGEKNELKDKLLDLEDLVRRLERETGPRQDDRIELNRLSEDNCVLKNNIGRFQQEMEAVGGENSKQRQNAVELHTEKEKLQSEMVVLSSQNKTYSDELCRLTARNLQLSDVISDLCAKAEESQNTIQLLNMRLAEITHQKEEEAAVAKQLQEVFENLEQQQLQQQSRWLRENELSEQELNISREKVANLTFQQQLLQQEKDDLLKEAEELKKKVANLTFQHQLLEQEKEEKLKEAEENKKKLFRMDSLQQEVNVLRLEKQSLEDKCQTLAKGLKDSSDQVAQMHTLETELQSVNEERQTLRQKQTELREELVESQDQVAQMHALETELQRVNQECQTLRQKQAELREELVESQNQVAQMHALETELQRVNQECQTLRQKQAELREELVESQDQITQMHDLKTELQSLHEECQTLRQGQVQVREELVDSQDQLLEANTRLTLAESQHMREVQHLKEKVYSAVSKDQLDKLQARLLEAQQKIQQLQEKLSLQAEQANMQLALQQEEHEKLLRRMEEKMLEVEMNLKTVRIMLQDKVNQLKEQHEKNAKSDLLLKDLYVENAQLMKALQVTEQRQKSAEKKNFVLDEKIAALNKLIRNIAPTSLSV